MGVQQEGADWERSAAVIEQRLGVLLNCANGTASGLGVSKHHQIDPETASSCLVGVLFDMWQGEISFTRNGEALGTPIVDKRLKQGKYVAAILLSSPGDSATLVNPRKVMQASLGYELLFKELGLLPGEPEASEESLES